MPVPLPLAVVPAGSGRDGPHPLLRLLSPALRLPVCALALRPGRQGRDFDPDRFSVRGARPGGRVLLVDDTWVSGASARPPQLPSNGPESPASRWSSRAATSIPVTLSHARWSAALPPARYDPYGCAVHSRSKYLMPADTAERTLRSRAA